MTKRREGTEKRDPAEREEKTVEIDDCQKGQDDHHQAVFQAVAQDEHRRIHGGRSAERRGKQQFAVAFAFLPFAGVHAVPLCFEETEREEVDGEDIRRQKKIEQDHTANSMCGTNFF